MKSALHMLAAFAVAGLAPAPVAAADLGDGYGERYEYPAYGNNTGREDYRDDYDERETVVERRRTIRDEDPDERYEQSVEYYEDEPVREYYVRPYRRPYLRPFDWRDRPGFAHRYRPHYRHARWHDRRDRW